MDNSMFFRFGILSVFLCLTCAMLGLLSTRIEAQPFIPPNANAGMIQSHHLNQMFIQHNMPWVNRPIMPEDYKPPEALETEPLIQFMNVEAQGSIILKNPDGSVRIESTAPSSSSAPLNDDVGNHNYQNLPPLHWDIHPSGE